MIVNGNFNALEFSDGFVDVMGVIKGSPAASGTVLTLSGDGHDQRTERLHHIGVAVPALQLHRTRRCGLA